MRHLRLLLICLPLLACACSPKHDPNVIRIANWGGAGQDGEYDRLIVKLYREFEAKHPGVKIKVENNPEGYVQKMILSFVAKAEPDLMMLDASSAAIFINNGVLEDLTPMIEADRDFKIGDFYENVVEIARRDKALYAIPQDFTPMVVYYNKRLFDEAGVPCPRGDWDFDAFLDTAQKLTKPEKGQYGFSFANWMPGWVMWIWNNGGSTLSPAGVAKGHFDSELNIGTLTFLSDLILKYKVAPSLSQTASMGVDPFANGQAAMTVSGHWSMVGYANAPKDANGKPKITWDDLGVAPMPHNGPRSRTVMYESGYAMGKHCRNKPLAWEFIKYMTSYEVQKQYQASGIAVCARKDVAEERARSGVAVEAEFIPIIETARPPNGALMEGYEFVEKMGASAMDSVLNGSKTVREALHEAAARIDKELAKQ